jgi:hypothetical protein
VGDAVAEALADGLWLTDDDEVADAEADSVALADADGLEDTDAERLDDGDVDALGLGLTEALILLDGLCEADGLGETEAEMLDDGDGLLLVDEDTEAENEALGDGETLADGEAETLADGDGLTDAETLGLTDADGPNAPNSSSVDAATNEWSTFRWSAGIWIGTICAPPRVLLTALGEAEALMELDAVALGDDEIDEEGVWLGEAEIEGLTDAEELLMISRTANVTIARSSDVAFVPPTGRLPCPAVVS